MAIPCSDSKYRENGAAAVELAVVLPVLILILLGIIQFGIILNAQITLTSAAREGARHAAVTYEKNMTEGEWREKVKDRVAGDLGAFSLLLNWEKGNIEVVRENQNGHYKVKVEVPGEVGFIVPMPGWMLDNPFEMTAASTMRDERSRDW